MSIFRQKIAWLLLLVTAGLSGCHRESGQPVPQVAVGNSYMECAVHDLLGPDTPVMRLAEPGMCPGHFDIRPSQVEMLRHCRLLVQLDFQQGLDDRFAGLRIAPIRIVGGLCEPDSYFAACRQTADALVAADLMNRDAADQRLAEITQRVNHRADAARQKIAALRDWPVLTSMHQQAFCRWLGLKVVGTFSGADTTGTAQLDRAVREGEQAKVRVIIANLPEGRRVADALADRLKANVVVFGNFPAINQGQASFDDLLQSNVDALLEATRP